VSGINDRQQLAEAESVMRDRINHAWMAHVTFRDPASTVVEPDVELEVDVELGRNVSLRGRTRVGHGARIDDGVILTDVEVGAGAEIKPYTLATDSVIGPNNVIGPFAHLRPGTKLGPEVHVGNFVEMKKTEVGRGSKANHLSYLGDATIGEKVNVGAGTITCNYNGYEKQRTIIEDQAFIGSDTQLVAPVRVGRGAVIAAGTTVVVDVAPGALAISRVPQIEKPGYADKVAGRYAEKKKAMAGPAASAAATTAGAGGKASTPPRRRSGTV
jgi:bifunctional UDP-N-acetylglucosamine pyrophosphorylase/glucosamine-1-phosphate N-acetyltransferase